MGFDIDLNPTGSMLFVINKDIPGVIGNIGSLLGEHNVNIAAMQVGRRIVRGEAVMVLSIDDPIPPELLISIHSIDGIQEAQFTYVARHVDGWRNITNLQGSTNQTATVQQEVATQGGFFG